MGEEIKELVGEFRIIRWGAYVVIVTLMFGTIYGLWDKFINKPVFTIYIVVLAI